MRAAAAQSRKKRNFHERVMLRERLIEATWRKQMKKFIICGALAAFALGTSAASAAEFYIVRDATTKKCTVVDTKPTTTTTTVVGDGVYKTKVEAESAVKTTKVCTEQ